jgi:hypothetical protein
MFKTYHSWQNFAAPKKNTSKVLQSAGRSTLSSLACIQTAGGKCVPWPRSLCPDPNWASSTHFGRACVTRSSRYLGFAASHGFWNNNCLPICFYLYVPLIAFISTKLFSVSFVAWFLPQKFVLLLGAVVGWVSGFSTERMVRAPRYEAWATRLGSSQTSVSATSHRATFGDLGTCHMMPFRNKPNPSTQLYGPSGQRPTKLRTGMHRWSRYNMNILLGQEGMN